MTTTPVRTDRTTGRSRVGTVVAAVLGLRMVGLVALVVGAGGVEAAHRRLTRWDANWYAGIAEHGYGVVRVLPDGRQLSDEAFFPLFPALERGVAVVTGLPVKDAGLVVSALALVAAAVGVHHVGAALAGPRAGLWLAVIWAGVPSAVVLTMAYSEALFAALAAWGLYAVVRRRWLLAAGAAVLAGLTRPVGAALVAAVLVAVAVEWVRLRRDPPSSSATGAGAGAGAGAELRTLVLAAVLAPLGWLGFAAWVGVREDTPLGYFTVQDGWGNGVDGGRAFVSFVVGHLTDVDHPADVAAGLGLVAGVVLVLGLLVLSVRDRQPPAVLVYSGVLVLVALLTARYFGSKPRYLLPAFPLLLPVAARLGSWTSRRPGPARTVRVAVGVVLVGSAAGGAALLLGSGPP